METIEAIYEGGVFRPIAPITLPEKARVHLQIVNKVPTNLESDDDMDEFYEILDRRYNTGITDLAARHNEHQP